MSAPKDRESIAQSLPCETCLIAFYPEKRTGISQHHVAPFSAALSEPPTGGSGVFRDGNIGVRVHIPFSAALKLIGNMMEFRVTLTSVNQRVSPSPTGPNVFLGHPG